MGTPLKSYSFCLRTQVYPVFTSVSYANRNRDVKKTSFNPTWSVSAVLLSIMSEYILMNACRGQADKFNGVNNVAAKVVACLIVNLS